MRLPTASFAVSVTVSALPDARGAIGHVQRGVQAVKRTVRHRDGRQGQVTAALLTRRNQAAVPASTPENCACTPTDVRHSPSTGGYADAREEKDDREGSSR